MEAQALDVVARILWADESGRIRIEPVVEARQQKPQRGTARENRQGFDFLHRQFAMLTIGRQKTLSLGDVVGAILFEAPGIEHHRDVIGEGIVAGEIEVDQPGDFSTDEQNIVRKEIGMDDAGR